MIEGRKGWIALAVAVPGVVLCVYFVGRFVATMLLNRLATGARPFFKEHYAAVGDAYSTAFVVGFFLCFFLMLAGIALQSLHAGRSDG